MATQVKICGMTRLEDARLALDLGAWAIGLIFHPPSPRYIDPDAARDLVRELPADTLSIGVFVDRPMREIHDIVEHVGLRGVQLHGKETPDEVNALSTNLSGSVVIKAFRVGEKFRVEDVDAYSCDYILLDTYRKGLQGGTGETFDWSVAHAVSQMKPTILAGGIGPENIADAIAAANPFAVDILSRTESQPGMKDSEQLHRVFEALKGIE